jgi:hypothetical protein
VLANVHSLSAELRCPNARDTVCTRVHSLTRFTTATVAKVSHMHVAVLQRTVQPRALQSGFQCFIPPWHRASGTQQHAHVTWYGSHVE